MDRNEVLDRLDQIIAKAITELGNMGIVAAFIRDIGDESDDFRMIYPDTLLVRPLLVQAVEHLNKKETQHRC